MSTTSPLPLSERKVDWFFVGFFAFNLVFVSYVISLEQIAVTNPAAGETPLWPPGAALQLIHWWEKTYDPLLWARPPWYRATIWIDVLVFGPFYAAALVAFVKGREWIRKPAFLWAGVMMTNVTIILFEELIGPNASPAPLVVVGANLSWFIVPLLLLARVWRDGPLFSKAAQ